MLVKRNVKSAEVFELSTLPVELGKIELPGSEWNKIQIMLEERQRMLVAKSVIVEANGIYGKAVYKTLSDEQHVIELAQALQAVQDAAGEQEKAVQAAITQRSNDFDHRINEIVRQRDEAQSEKKEALTHLRLYKNRSLFRRIFNLEPK